MKVCSVSTNEYKVDIKKLLERRLNQAGWAFTLTDVPENKSKVEIEIEDEDAMNAWCEAVAKLLAWDISHFELARMVNEIPVPLAQKQLILPEAIKNARESTGFTSLKRSVREHYEASETLNLEGYVRFRMQEYLMKWELCVDRAAEELMLKTEYLELMGVLNAFVRMQPSKIEEISVVINPDGSCTLTDNSDSRIDYSNCDDEGMISVLVNLAPERITVYDLSNGQNTVLSEALRRVFEDRIKFL